MASSIKYSSALHAEAFPVEGQSPSPPPGSPGRAFLIETQPINANVLPLIHVLAEFPPLTLRASFEWSPLVTRVLILLRFNPERVRRLMPCRERQIREHVPLPDRHGMNARAASQPCLCSCAVCLLQGRRSSARVCLGSMAFTLKRAISCANKKTFWLLCALHYAP